MLQKLEKKEEKRSEWEKHFAPLRIFLERVAECENENSSFFRNATTARNEKLFNFPIATNYDFSTRFTPSALFLSSFCTPAFGFNFHEQLTVGTFFVAQKKFPPAHKKFKVIKTARRMVRGRDEKSLKSHLILLESLKILAESSKVASTEEHKHICSGA